VARSGLTRCARTWSASDPKRTSRPLFTLMDGFDSASVGCTIGFGMPPSTRDRELMLQPYFPFSFFEGFLAEAYNPRAPDCFISRFFLSGSSA
jgi:hypothetical protein